MDLQTILWATGKVAAALVVVYLWIRLIQWHVVPYFRSNADSVGGNEGSSPGSAKRFPFLRLGGLIVLSLAAMWLAQAEFAYRSVAGTPDRSIDRDRAQKLRAESTQEPGTVPPDGEESLDERTKRMLEEAKSQNNQAKEDFLKNKVPPQ